jgi:hypothetical protein
MGDDSFDDLKITKQIGAFINDVTISAKNNSGSRREKSKTGLTFYKQSQVKAEPS